MHTGKTLSFTTDFLLNRLAVTTDFQLQMTPGQDNEALKTNGVTLLARTMAYHVIATYTKKYEERSRIFISLPYSHEKLNANNQIFMLQRFEIAL